MTGLENNKYISSIEKVGSRKFGNSTLITVQYDSEGKIFDHVHNSLNAAYLIETTNNENAPDIKTEELREQNIMIIGMPLEKMYKLLGPLGADLLSPSEMAFVRSDNASSIER